MLPTFLFDTIVTRLELTKDKVDDPQGFTVNLKFNNIPIVITPSRINVNEFQDGRQKEITTDAEKLSQAIESQGLSITVRYYGNTLGSAVLTFPQTFIDSIQPDMDQILHQDKCILIRRGMDIGTVELLCSLYRKCENQTEPIE